MIYNSNWHLTTYGISSSGRTTTWNVYLAVNLHIFRFESATRDSNAYPIRSCISIDIIYQLRDSRRTWRKYKWRHRKWRDNASNEKACSVVNWVLIAGDKIFRRWKHCETTPYPRCGFLRIFAGSFRSAVLADHFLRKFSHFFRSVVLEVVFAAISPPVLALFSQCSFWGSF